MGERDQSASRAEMVVVIDCFDLARSAAFWCEALGYRGQGGPVGQQSRYLSLRPPGDTGVEVLLQRVDDRKVSKNRVHLDLRVARTAQSGLDSEVERLVAAGAGVVSAEPLAEDGWRWLVLADPDGNEFCVVEMTTGPSG